jgi:hypothetical protein
VADLNTQPAGSDPLSGLAAMGDPSFVSPYDEQQRKINLQRMYGEAIRRVATGMNEQANVQPTSFHGGGGAGDIGLARNPGWLSALAPLSTGMSSLNAENTAQTNLNTAKRAEFDSEMKRGSSLLLPENYPQKQRIDPSTGQPQMQDGKPVMEADIDSAQREMIRHGTLLSKMGPAAAGLSQALIQKGTTLASIHTPAPGQQVATFNQAAPQGQQYQPVGGVPEFKAVGPAETLAATNPKTGTAGATGVQGPAHMIPVPWAPGYFYNEWQAQAGMFKPGKSGAWDRAEPEMQDRYAKRPLFDDITGKIKENAGVKARQDSIASYQTMQKATMGKGGEQAMLAAFDNILGATQPRAALMGGQVASLTNDLAGRLQYYKSIFTRDGVLDVATQNDMLANARQMIDIQDRIVGPQINGLLKRAADFGIDPHEIETELGLPALPAGEIPPHRTPAAVSKQAPVPQGTKAAPAAHTAPTGGKKSLDEIFK